MHVTATALSPPQLCHRHRSEDFCLLTLSASLLPIINKHVVAALFFPDPLFDMIITPAQRVRIGNDQRLSFAGGNIYQYCQYLCLYRMIKRLFVTSDVIAVLYRTTDTPHFTFFLLIPCQSQSAEVDRNDRVGYLGSHSAVFLAIPAAPSSKHLNCSPVHVFKRRRMTCK